jgi:hypothetical protein
MNGGQPYSKKQKLNNGSFSGGARTNAPIIVDEVQEINNNGKMPIEDMVFDNVYSLLSQMKPDMDPNFIKGFFVLFRFRMHFPACF